MFILSLSILFILMIFEIVLILLLENFQFILHLKFIQILETKYISFFLIQILKGGLKCVNFNLDLTKYFLTVNLLT